MNNNHTKTADIDELEAITDENQAEKEEDHATKKSEEQILQEKISLLEEKLTQADNQAKLALADYQNLQRRSREERIKTMQNASIGFAEAIIEPLKNLSLAANALNDVGLNMVMEQLWTALKEQGLEELGNDLVGKDFDVDKMEAIEFNGQEGEETEIAQVDKVIAAGYTMNGQVIAFAKVSVSSK